MSNRGKFSKLLWLLLIVAFAAIAGGGCGGGSSSSRGGVKSAEELMSDGMLADAAGLMEIFSIPGLDPSALIEASLSKSGFVEGQEIRSIPSMVYRPVPEGRSSSLGAAAVDDEEDMFSPMSADVYKLVGLRANVRYTVEISENRAQPLMFMPVIQLRKWGDEGTESPSYSGEVNLEPDDTVGNLKRSDLEGKSKSEIKSLLIADGFSEEDAEEIAELIASGKTDTTPGHAVTISDPHLALDLSTYPAEAPGIIAASFVAPSAGDYELSVGGMADDDDDDDYLLCVYEERGDATTGYGYPEIIRFEDGSLFTVDDQITLRKAVLEYNLYRELYLPDLDAIESDLSDLYTKTYGVVFDSSILDKMHLPDPAKVSAKDVRAAADGSARPTPGDAYDKAKERMLPANGQRSTIPVEVNDVRRIPKFTMTMGDTFDGPTGLKRTSAINTVGRAVDFDDNWDNEARIKAPVASSRVKLITTESQNEEEMEVTTTAGISLAKFSIENKNRVKKSMKHGLTTATLLLKYVVWDPEYRSPKGGFKLSQDAADYLAKNGSSEFRKRYGDYFVSGIRYGGRFEATVTMTAETRERMTEVENAINTKISAFSASNDFTQKLKDTMKNVTIEINIYEEGGSNGADSSIKLSGTNNEDIIEQMMTQFNAFVSASKKDDFRAVPVFYQLMRLRELKRDDIDDQIDVAPEALLASRKLVRTMAALDSYYNVLSSIPDGNLVGANSLRASWQRDYEKQEMADAQLDDIFTSVEKMKNKTKELEEICDRFRVMTERWSFYKYLLNEQRNFKSMGVHHNLRHMKPSSYAYTTWSWGCRAYPYSPAVDKNFISPEYPESVSRPAKLWYRHEWQPRIERYGGTRIIAYHRVGCRCDCNTLENRANAPTVGSHAIHWFFFGKGTQRVDWEWGIKWYDLKPDEFPFSGLEG